MYLKFKCSVIGVIICLILSIFLSALVMPVGSTSGSEISDGDEPENYLSESYSTRAEEGEWTEVESIDTGDDVNTDHLLEGENGTIFWSFGSSVGNASLYRSTEGGYNWTLTEWVETEDEVLTDHLLKTENGTIFWSFGDRDGSASLYRSMDGGENWSEVERVDDNDRVLTDHLLEDEEGDLYWSFGTRNEYAHIYRSVDGGENWTEMGSIEAEDDVNTDHLLEDEEGNIFWSFGDDDEYAYLYRSVDGGESWAEIESIEAGDGVNTDHLLEDEEGDLYWSFGSDDNRAFLYRSIDGGENWDQVEEVDTAGDVNTDYILEDEKGDIFWSFGCDSDWDVGAFLYRSTDGGETWFEQEIIWLGNNVNTNHLLEDEEGNLFWSFGTQGNYAYIYRSMDGGDNWALIEYVATEDDILTDHLLSTENGDLYWSFGVRENDGSAYLYHRKFPAVPNELEISPLETTMKAGETLAYDVTVYDQIGNLMDIGPEEIDWKIDENADGGWNENEYTAETAGSWIVTATLTHEEGNLTEKAFLHVEPGEVDEISILPDEDRTVQAGDELIFSAEALDGYENLITKDVAEFEWENAVNGVFSKSEAGEYDVIANYEGIESSTVTVTVEPADSDSLEIEPVKETLVAGENVTYTSTVYDEFGNEIGDVTEETEWSIDEGAGGVWENNTFTSEVAGEWTVEGHYEGSSDTVDLVVEPCEVESVSITPEEETVQAGDVLEFTAEALDGYGNLITKDVAEFGWENASNGIFSKTEIGEYEVTGTYDGETSSSITITVEPSDPAHLDIEPGYETVTVGETVAYTATFYDEYDNEIGDGTEETDWSIEEDAGGEWEQDVYLTENAGEWTVTGTYVKDEEITGHAVLNVLSPDTVWVDITHPEEDQLFTERDVTVEWRSENAESHEIRLNEGGWIDAGLETSHTFENLSEGYHIVEVKSVGEGRYAVDEVGFTVDLDAEMPVLTVTSPAEDEIFSEKNVTVRWDSERVENHEIRLNEEGWIDVGLETTYEFEGLDDGEHSVEVRAADEHEVTVESSVNFIVDTLPPEIEFISPEEGEVLDEDTVLIEWDYEQAISGIDRFEIRLDGSEWEESGVFTQYEFTDLSDGEYTLELRAVDNAGNVGEETLTFEVSAEEESLLPIPEESCLLPLILTIIIAILMIAVWYRWEEEEEEEIAPGEPPVPPEKSPIEEKREAVKEVPSSGKESKAIPEESEEKKEECPLCGASVSAEDEECQACGEPLVEEDGEKDLRRCPLCGTDVPEGAESCSICGEPIEEEHNKESRSEEEIVEEPPEETKIYEETDLSEEKVLEDEVPREEAIEDLTRLKGLGSSKAEKLYEKGIRSLEELKELSREELKEVEGIGPTLSEKIHRSLEELEK